MSPVTPNQGIAALNDKLNQVKEAGSTGAVVESPTRAAERIGQQVRAEAARRGHAIGIRVIARDNRVRLTVTGPQAARYRGAVSDAMNAALPSITTEVRAMITRRAQ